MSEFGYGLVVPLVKFSSHLDDRFAQRVNKAIQWQQMTPIEREKIQEAEDSVDWTMILVQLDTYDIELVIAESMSIWAQGASDHLFGVDKTMAPQALLDLSEILTELRFMSRAGNADDWKEIKRLWMQATLDLDEMLGTDPEWGDWN